MTVEKPKIFLNDQSILSFLQPLPKDSYPESKSGNSLTKVIKYIGFETVHEEFEWIEDKPLSIDQFLIVASAVIYEAEIVRTRQDSAVMEPIREKLFSGGVTIHRYVDLPEPREKGYAFERQGRIWTATPAFRMTLRNLVIGGQVPARSEQRDDTGKIIRPAREESSPVDWIEAILAGYAHQESYGGKS